MNTSTVTPEIARFAGGVRAALADLPAEEVDDLTEGLEADLAESLAEDLRRTLPDPVEYAAELRLAAGLPGRVAPAGRGLSAAWTGLRQSYESAVRDNPTLAAGVEFANVLRPAWWLLRAWIATWPVGVFLGMQSASWILFIVFAVISVQWGRGQWQFRGVRELVVVGNVIAAVALLPMASSAWNSSDEYSAGYSDGVNDVGSGGVTGSEEGLSFNGSPLENIYAYDSAGNKLTGVQLFDVDGHPLEPYRNEDETQVRHTPATLDTGAEVYNVYPLQIVRLIWGDTGELVPDPNPDPAEAAASTNGPFLKVPAVLPPPLATP